MAIAPPASRMRRRRIGDGIYILLLKIIYAERGGRRERYGRCEAVEDDLSGEASVAFEVMQGEIYSVHAVECDAENDEE